MEVAVKQMLCLPTSILSRFMDPKICLLDPSPSLFSPKKGFYALQQPMQINQLPFSQSFFW
jgi:hypothetical protein